MSDPNIQHDHNPSTTPTTQTNDKVIINQPRDRRMSQPKALKIVKSGDGPPQSSEQYNRDRRMSHPITPNEVQVAKENHQARMNILEGNINDEIKKLWDQLKEVNLKLWEIEDKVRLAEKNKKFDEEFIKLARSVYQYTANRAKIKSDINQLSGSNIKEIKQYTKY